MVVILCDSTRSRVEKEVLRKRLVPLTFSEHNSDNLTALGGRLMMLWGHSASNLVVL